MREFLIPLATGLAIFMFGMQVLRIGLDQFNGKRLRMWLYQFTQTPLIGFLTGLVTTMIFQSSSAVTVLAIGFVNAKFMRFSQCIALLLGTNLGSCLTTELLVFPVEEFALWFLIAGGFCWMLPWNGIRYFGLAAAGLGCIFLGMDTMEHTAGSFRSLELIDSISTYADITYWGLLLGTVLTAIIQSSSAAIALMMGLYDVDIISLPFSLAAVLGSNVGTCVTAAVAAIGGTKGGKQVALAHFLINVFGLLVFYPFIPLISEWISHTELSRYAQVAHFHTGFNLVCAVLLLPFCRQIAQTVTRLLPE